VIGCRHWLPAAHRQQGPELGVEDLKQHDGEVSELERALHNFAWRMGRKRSEKNQEQQRE
jgi:hypothetical protein